MGKANLFSLMAVILFSLQLSAKDYTVSDFGARADGVFINTCSIQKAIDFISENGGGRLVFEAGNYVTGSIYLKSNVTLQLNYGATILGSTNPFDYIKDKKIGWMSMIFAVNQENIGITGKGTINGRGFITANNMVNYIHRGIYTDPLKLDRPNETNRPQNIYFRECKNVTNRSRHSAYSFRKMRRHCVPGPGCLIVIQRQHSSKQIAIPSATRFGTRLETRTGIVYLPKTRACHGSGLGATFQTECRLLVFFQPEIPTGS